MNGISWPEVATAARAQTAALRPAQLTALGEDTTSLDVKEMYTQLKALGLHYGPKFQVLSNVLASAAGADADVELQQPANRRCCG